MKLLIFLCLIPLVVCSEERKYARAVVESCPGCSLNRLPEVKKFIYEDLPKYENVEFKKISGARPILNFMDENDEAVESYFLEVMDREECNHLLQSNGFPMTVDKEL